MIFYLILINCASSLCEKTEWIEKLMSYSIKLESISCSERKCAKKKARKLQKIIQRTHERLAADEYGDLIVHFVGTRHTFEEVDKVFLSLKQMIDERFLVKKSQRICVEDFISKFDKTFAGWGVWNERFDVNSKIISKISTEFENKKRRDFIRKRDRWDFTQCFY
ncbi:hypothetical protein TUBRATIS_17590 [Tubulinosema ratisbonensis]|uniref:Uncharacterized protein n=1 Tax=Tubulinosema ratisbonensis TaxID=291195 RepID=A0A437AL95_9MICR|nr:hypothetical protein TUBRATIS_17590 [Tubulinosema ratisbonensis]